MPSITLPPKENTLFKRILVRLSLLLLLLLVLARVANASWASKLSVLAVSCRTQSELVRAVVEDSSTFDNDTRL